MTASQRLTLRTSEVRSRLNEISGLEGDAFTDEIRQESDTLAGEYRDLETKLRAATIAESADERRDADTTGEDRELRELVSRASLGSIFEAAVEHRQTEGAESELQKHFGLGHNQVPLDLLRGTPEEHRAVTPGPGNVGATQSEIVQPVFSTGEGEYLSFSQPTVGVGEAVFPVLTTRPTVGGPHSDANETTVNETTGAFTADMLSPQRLQAAFNYKRVDVARFAGMSEALRSALSMGLAEKVDAEIVARIVTDVPRVDAAAADTFASYQKRLIYDNIDGRYAMEEGGLRYLVGAPTLGDMAPLYKSAESPENFPAFIRRQTGGLRVSAHIAAVSGNKQDVIVRRGSRADGVAALWQGVTLLPDEITRVKVGEIVITSVLLAAFKITRADGFRRIQAQHS